MKKFFMLVLMISTLGGCDFLATGLDRTIDVSDPEGNGEKLLKAQKEVSQEMALLLGRAIGAQAQLAAQHGGDLSRIDGMTFREVMLDYLDLLINFEKSSVAPQFEKIASLNAEKNSVSQITAGPIKGVYNCPACGVAFDIVNNSPVAQSYFDMEGSVLIDGYGVCNYSTKGYTTVLPQNFRPGMTHEIYARCINLSSSGAAVEQSTEVNDPSQATHAVFNGDNEIAWAQSIVERSDAKVAEFNKTKQEVSDYQW